jgi:hypothetical protein
MLEFIPSPICIEKFPCHHQIKQKVLFEIENAECEKSSDGYISRYDWIHSHKNDRKWVKEFDNYLKYFLDRWAQTFEYNNCIIHELWFQQYNTNSQHDWHIHGHNFTGVYFIELPLECPKTQWVNFVDKSANEFNVKEGDILIFPSFIFHRAPINQSTERKTIISWNMDVNLNYNKKYHFY